MNAQLYCSVLLALGCAALGCGGDTTGTTANPPTTNGRQNSDVAGGATTDFTGDPVTCTAEREEAVPGAPQLSMAELIAGAEGDFSIPIRWESRCSEPEIAALPACQDERAGFRVLDGTETTVRLSMLYDGSNATVTYRAPDDPPCEPTSSVPMVVRLTSLDGVLDEIVPRDRADSCSANSGTGFRRPLEDFTGRLGSSEMGFPGEFHVEVTAGFFDERMWFDLHVAADDQPSLFSIDLPPYGMRTHDVPKNLVLPSAPLAPGHCGPGPTP